MRGVGGGAASAASDLDEGGGGEGARIGVPDVDVDGRDGDPALEDGGGDEHVDVASAKALDAGGALLVARGGAADAEGRGQVRAEQVDERGDVAHERHKDEALCTAPMTPQECGQQLLRRSRHGVGHGQRVPVIARRHADEPQASEAKPRAQAQPRRRGRRQPQSAGRRPVGSAVRRASERP